MLSFENIITLCWIVFMLYWFLNWSNVKPTKEKKAGIGELWIRVLMVAIVIACILVSKRFGISGITTTLYSFPWIVQLCGVLLAIVGLGVAIVARKTLAKNWSATMDVKQGHELITHGIYGYIRHPIYTGIILMGVGTLLISLSWSVVIIAAFVLGMFLVRIKNEEALMTQTFPKEYPSYKKRTKKLIPFVW